MYPLSSHVRCAIGADLAVLHDRLQKDAPNLFDANDVCTEILHQCKFISNHLSPRDSCFAGLIKFCDLDKTCEGGSGMRFVSHPIHTLDDLRAEPIVRFVLIMYISRLI
jgi:hypothetical protein